MHGQPNGSGIGQPVRRREDRRLLTGRGRYSDDLNLAGQAHAVFVRSPHAHALIRRLHAAAARGAPGVLAVLTADEARADGLNPLPHIANNHPADIAIQNKDGSPTVRPQQHPIVFPEICHVGEIVAAVVAETVDAAKDAAELVEIEWEVLPAVARGLDAAAVQAPRARLDSPNVILDGEIGDEAAAAAAFARAAHVVTLDTWVQRVAGVPMEPRAAVGEYDPATNMHICHAGAGGAVSPRRDLALVFGIPPEQARMVMHDIGGNFGTRGSFSVEFALVVWTAKRLGRPVKWTSERSEYFVADYQARDLACHAELALDKDGTFLAMRGSNLVNQGAYAIAFGSLNKGVEIMSSIYHVPAVHFRARAALTNTLPTRPYRSSGRPEVMFVMERLIDLAALETGIDRIELRRRNLVSAEMMPYTNPFGMIYDSGEYHDCMARALRLGDWNGFAARRAEAKSRGRARGIGVANYVDTATGAPREKAEMVVKPEGIVEVAIGTVSQGQGHETSFAQLVTEFLGVPLDSVELVTGDTARVSIGGGAHSGRALRLGSIVMHNASQAIIEKGLQIASHVLEANVADIEFAGGDFTVKGTDRALGIFDVARAALERDDLPDELRGPLGAESDETVTVAAFPYGCHVCEVEIDPETGVLDIVRYSAVDDVGRAVNPMIVHGQVHGGIVQGIGQAIQEDAHYDRTSAQPLAGSFMDYAMPRADRMPRFDCELSEVPSPTHPLGIRPGGEGGTTPALAVVINAVVDALADYGVTHLEMPATPERIWRAIHGKRPP
ncbi:MAG: xanthine dehydrogenase family protein molybdopterin-binding subunit [Alphaproteobacteria bacterium]|nr:xanthine dehydrogenase family protein molybdopterin-binding subunit [Alphaproteobacteria bacterium]